MDLTEQYLRIKDFYKANPELAQSVVLHHYSKYLKRDYGCSAINAYFREQREDLLSVLSQDQILAVNKLMSNIDKIINKIIEEQS